MNDQCSQHRFTTILQYLKNLMVGTDYSFPSFQIEEFTHEKLEFMIDNIFLQNIQHQTLNILNFKQCVVDQLDDNYNLNNLKKLRRSRFAKQEFLNMVNKLLKHKKISMAEKNDLLEFLETLNKYTQPFTDTTHNFSYRYTNPFYSPLLFYTLCLSRVNHTYVKIMTSLISFINKTFFAGNAATNNRYVPIIKRQNFFMWFFDLLNEFLNNMIYCETTQKVATPLYGLNTIGGPKNFKKEKIIEQVHDWIQKPATLFNGEKWWSFFEETIDERIKNWVLRRQPGSKLRFDEYTTDPTKWATSGGTQKVTLPNGETVRNKWGYAIGTSMKGEDIYQSCLQNQTRAAVALKEEVKTRTIISTPLASYLRQSYIYDVLGNIPNLQSPINSPNITQNFFLNIGKYLCLDASKFDNNISFEMIRTFFEKIKKYAIMSYENCYDDKEVMLDLIDVIDQELENLKELHVDIFGEKIKYKKGLLSGWRLTTLMGTLFSSIVCDGINRELGTSFEYLTQGDDIIMRIDEKLLEKEVFFNICEQMGMKINYKKSTFGYIGEFLKYRYHNFKIDAIPARAVRSIFYANPWLSEDYTVAGTLNTIINTHRTLTSRLSLVTENLKCARMIDYLLFQDIVRWSRGRINIKECYQLNETPITMGGFGFLENVNMIKCKQFLNTYQPNANITFTTLNLVTSDFKKKNDPLFTFLDKYGLIPNSNLSEVLFQKQQITIKRQDVTKKLFNNFMNGRMMVENDNAGLHENVFQEAAYDNRRMSFNKYGTIMSILCKKTSKKEFANASKTCKGPVCKFESGVLFRLQNSSFTKALNYFFNVSESFSFPHSLFVNTRYHSSNQARLMNKLFVRSFKKFNLNTCLFLNLYLSASFLSTRTFIHSM